MEPVTHLLTGACLSRTGLNRRAAYATLTMVVAAEFPDIDTLWGLRGPVEGFEHHRGITHTFLGLPFEAALIVAAVYGLHRWRVRRAAATSSSGPSRPLTLAPVRWPTLYGLALLGLLSHLLLDYTNNYGLRPFYPFDPHWYAASIVFIFDPLIFLLLAGALLAPALFGLVGAEVGARRRPFRGRGWAIAALLAVVALWGLRAVEHERALQMLMAQSVAAPAPQTGDPPATGVPTPQPASQPDAESAPVYLQAQRALAGPDPLSPFRWSGVVDFGPVYQLNEVDVLNDTLSPADHFVAKPQRTSAVLAAEASPLGRAYIDWSPMPFVHASSPQSGAAPGQSVTAVTFRDPRFLGEWYTAHGRHVLAAVVRVDASGRVLSQQLDGRSER
jgi:inner membrane protein